MCNAVGNAIPCSEVEPMRVMGWQGQDFLGFECASIMSYDACGETIDYVIPVTDGSSA